MHLSPRSLLSVFSNDLAIDLGTTNSKVFSKGNGIVVSEPSIIAIDEKTGNIEAVGAEAKAMLGRTPGHINLIRPLRSGVIADFEYTEKILSSFIRQAHSRRIGVHPRIVIGVPCEITQVERRAVRDSALSARAAEVYLVVQPMMAAIGAGLPVTEPIGNMIVDIGGGTTDVAVISMAGIVYAKTVHVAGHDLDNAIMLYVRKKHNLLIGERTAENAKIELGTALATEHPRTMEIKGRDLLAGKPKTIEITEAEVGAAIAEPIATIVDAVRDALEQTPPELAADIFDHGIVLSGGTALLRNLDRRLSDETGLPVAVADDPLNAVALGIGTVLTDFDLLRRVALD